MRCMGSLSGIKAVLFSKGFPGTHNSWCGINQGPVECRCQHLDSDRADVAQDAAILGESSPIHIKENLRKRAKIIQDVITHEFERNGVESDGKVSLPNHLSNRTR